MLILKSFNKVSFAEIVALQDNSDELIDNRFAVINGLLFELSEFYTNDDSYHVVVSVFDCADVFSPADSKDLSDSYNEKYFIVAYRFNTLTDGQNLFMSLIAETLNNAQALRELLQSKAQQ